MIWCHRANIWSISSSCDGCPNRNSTESPHTNVALRPASARFMWFKIEILCKCSPHHLDRGQPGPGWRPCLPGVWCCSGARLFSISLLHKKLDKWDLLFGSVGLNGTTLRIFEGTPRLHGGPHWHLDLDHIIGGQRARTRMLTIEPLMLRACGHEMGVFLNLKQVAAEQLDAAKVESWI